MQSDSNWCRLHLDNHKTYGSLSDFSYQARLSYPHRPRTPRAKLALAIYDVISVQLCSPNSRKFPHDVFHVRISLFGPTWSPSSAQLPRPDPGLLIQRFLLLRRKFTGFDGVFLRFGSEARLPLRSARFRQLIRLCCRLVGLLRLWYGFTEPGGNEVGFEAGEVERSVVVLDEGRLRAKELYG